MFSKADIKRFNDIQSCAPPPGTYNYPRQTEASVPSTPTFGKGSRFRQSEFAVPRTPLRSGRLERGKYPGSGTLALIQNSANDELQRSLTHVEDEVKGLTKIKLQLETELRVSTDRIKNLEDKLFAIESRSKEEEEQLRLQQSINGSLKSDLEDSRHLNARVVELEESNCKLVSKNVDKDLEIKRLEDQLNASQHKDTQIQEELQNEIRRLTSVKNQIKEELQNEIRRLTAVKNQIATELSTSTAYVKELEERLFTSTDEIERLTAVKNQSATDLSTSTAYVKELEERLFTSADEIQRLTAVKNQLATDLSTSTACVKELEERLFTSADEIQRLTAVKNQISTDLSASTAYVKELEERLFTSTGLLREKEQEVCRQNTLIGSLEINLADAEHLKDKVVELEQSKSELIFKNVNKDLEINRLEEQLNASQHKDTQIKEELQSEIRRLTAVKNELATDLSTSTAYAKELEERLFTSTGLLREKEQEVCHQITRISSLEINLADAEHLKAKVEELEQSKLELISKNVEKDSEVERLQVELEACQHKAREVKDVLQAEIRESLAVQNQLQIDFNVSAAHIKTLNQKLSASEASSREKDEEICCQHSLIDTFEVSLKDSNNQREILKENLAKLQHTNSALMTKISDKEGDIQRLMNELDSSKGEANQLKDRIKYIEDNREKMKQLLESAIHDGEGWKTRYHSAVEETQKHIERLKLAEIKLGDYLNLQLKGASQVAEINARDKELAVQELMFSKVVNGSVSKQKLSAVEQEMFNHKQSSDKWKAMYDHTKTELDQTRHEATESHESLSRTASQMKELMVQKANLEKLIGPFKEQLKQYKSCLDMEHDAAARQAEFAKDIADKYAAIIGHQNPRQKIQHMQKLKNDNLTLKNENTILQKKLTQSQKRLMELEGKCGQIRRFDPLQAFKSNPNDAEDI